MMRAISCLTVAHLCSLSVVLLWFASYDFSLLPWIGGVLIAAWPILVSWILAKSVPRREMRGCMLIFDVLFCMLTVATIDQTYFSGEQDAQSGLLMLAIPAGGLIGLVFMGLLGAVFTIAAKRS